MGIDEDKRGALLVAADYARWDDGSWLEPR